MQCRSFILIAGFAFLLCPFLAAAETPSDNAADLYIKCFQRFKKPDDAVGMQITNLPTATEKPSPEVVAFIEEQRKNSLIADIEAASKVKNCDWKLDYSKGFELRLLYLTEVKELGMLLYADGVLATTQGDCETAINRNLAVWRMGHHRAGKTTIEFLTSLSLIAMSETGLRQTLGMCTMDSTRLASLKKELLTESNRPTEPYRLPSIKDCILGEKGAMLIEFPKVKFGLLENFINTEPMKKHKEQIRGHFKADDPNTPDPAWIASSIQYMENYYASILAAVDKPYPIAVAELKQAHEKVLKDADAGNDAAFLTAIILPPWNGTYGISIRIRTQCNALLMALDVYAAAKQTGQLPKELPNTLYVDRFSGKPFIYEITPTGFRLRCRQESITGKDKKTWEWEYTVKKS